ncbi:hypothetical protein [Halorubellus litoreus]|uniref:Uncharacterized protein n=1 Tax=Halorubellus litoreus TaxID=755308 RepID=A0ABD5VAB5_9EURY
MGAADPGDESATDRITAADEDAPATDAEERVDVVWFPADDDYVVVAAGDGDRAVAFHRYGRLIVAGIGALFAALGVVILHGFVTANTSLAWPTSGVVFGVGALAATAYVYWRYDPEPAPGVVARDEPVDSARDEFDFED